MIQIKALSLMISILPLMHVDVAVTERVGEQLTRVKEQLTRVNQIISS